MDPVINVSRQEPDESGRVLADSIAAAEAREFRRFFVTRLGLIVAAAWLLSWPIHLLPHTVVWTLLATAALVIGLTSPGRRPVTTADRRMKPRR